MEFKYVEREFQGRQVSVPIPNYQYQTYDTRDEQIRLILIKPSEDKDALVECKLLQFNLDNPPDYTALSYSCGDPSQWTLIHVDGYEFPVSNNLDKALRRLRSAECALVWVDAISINQIDLGEKSAAIHKMNQIYHKARSVSVWLGPHADGSELVMAMLTTVEQSRQPAHLKTKQPWSPSAKIVQELTGELQSFFQRSYWTRVWIVQEVALGSEVVVYCGTHMVHWKAIEAFLDVLASTPHSLSQCLGQVQHICKTRLSVMQSRPLSLLQAIFDNASSLATVRLDKVYALLGLASDRADFVAKPTYKTTEEQLCADMMQSVVGEKKNLDIIFAAFSGDYSVLPSWCPNFLGWTQSRCLEKLIPYLVGQSLCYRNGKSTHRWSASGDSLVTRDTFDITPDQIRTRGYLISRVVSLGCSMWTANQVQSTKMESAHSLSEFNNIYRSLNRALTLYDPEGSSAKPPPLLYHLFNFDKFRNIFSSTRPLKDRHQAVIQWRWKNREFTIRGKTINDRSNGFRAGYESGELKYDLMEMGVAGLVVATTITGPYSPMTSIAGNNYKRSLPNEIDRALSNLGSIISEDLRVMATDKDDAGWAHPSADLDDQIFLLQGCSMPIILRPALHFEGAYTVVGHAYVAGVMDGEVWSKLDEDDLQDLCLV